MVSRLSVTVTQRSVLLVSKINLDLIYDGDDDSSSHTSLGVEGVGFYFYECNFLKTLSKFLS